MKIYVAAPWADRELARAAAKKFEEAGHTITHNWWDYDVPIQDTGGMRKCAEDDFYAVQVADVFFLMNLQKRGEETSGKAVELGIALAGRRSDYCSPSRIFAMGHKGTNVFQFLADVEWVESVEEAIGQIN